MYIVKQCNKVFKHTGQPFYLESLKCWPISIQSRIQILPCLETFKKVWFYAFCMGERPLHREVSKVFIFKRTNPRDLFRLTSLYLPLSFVWFNIMSEVLGTPYLKGLYTIMITFLIPKQYAFCLKLVYSSSISVQPPIVEIWLQVQWRY
jgi:hypothetical protein